MRQDASGRRGARPGRISGLAFGALLILGLALPGVAGAQFSDTYKFLDAVRKSDNEAVVKAVETPGVTPINTKDRSTGETALHITVARRDLTWTNYLLSHGARADLTDNLGRSPLMLAVERRFVEGVQLLLLRKANPNQANDSGETPIIRAVQLNDLETVRILMAGGADPNRKDTLAGKSAIDYAKDSNRSNAMIETLTAGQAAPRNKAVQGPHL